MKKQFILLAASLFAASGLYAQNEGYQFTEVIKLPATPVKNQAATGTCWCFATTSFMESELLRQGKGTYDLSEMFIVRQKYLNQLDDNYLRQGKGNIGEGSLSHTFINAYKKAGIVPEEAYSGLVDGQTSHNHSEMTSYLEAIANTAIKNKSRSPKYYEQVNNLFDTYMGPIPEKFTYNGKEYTPQSFAASLGLNMNDYVELTSFTHKPYYELMEVEVPDNWEHERSYNIPLDELISAMDYALNKGYTLCWDGDVSEKGFSYRNGVAINPDVKTAKRGALTDQERFEGVKKANTLDEAYKFETPYAEVNVTPEIRQQGYESFVTTDDHLMHVVGIAKDQNGTKYYITKNSWGESNPQGGYLNMSESYVKAKTIYVMLHKDALSKELKQKLNIK